MIKVYLTGENGNGYVTPLGEYESIEDVSICIGAFADDGVITFEIIREEEE